MSSKWKRKLPECFGSFGDSDDCFVYDVKDECEETTDDVNGEGGGPY